MHLLFEALEVTAGKCQCQISFIKRVFLSEFRVSGLGFEVEGSRLQKQQLTFTNILDLFIKL